MQDAWRAYFELASGVTEASRKKATKVVRKLVGKGGATAEQLQALAGELVATSAANRESLSKLVRFEVDRALGAVGLATADEVGTLTKRIRQLEGQLRDARSAAEGGSAPVAVTSGGGRAEAARSEAAKKTVAKKTVAKKATAPAKAAPAKATTATAAPAAKATKAAKAAKKTAPKKASPTSAADEQASPAKSAAKAAPRKASATASGAGSVEASES